MTGNYNHSCRQLGVVAVVVDGNRRAAGEEPEAPPRPLEFDSRAPVNWVLLSHGGVEFNRLYGHDLFVWAQILEQILHVLDSEKSVNVLENSRLVGRKEWCENAVGVAPPPLVLAGGASLAGAALESHLEARHNFIFFF
ncbi:ribosomal RNA small subunit methyltransferase A [Striga asiatica]|uniref:Ribosomal RNA small subunit methyltransferase A n=1 Tax=Striga asiatica TaxID=4170 RepID=A0A5A7QXH6_STRAF|nr:ribosomal RNA small subunit methyltransferase A [Striga asiatica]